MTTNPSALTASPSSAVVRQPGGGIHQRRADRHGVQPQQHRGLGLVGRRNRAVQRDATPAAPRSRPARPARSASRSRRPRPGRASGTLSVASSAPGSPLTVALSGTGTTSGGGEGPYGGTPAAIPGTVQASNYDTGGQGVAYNVTSVNGTGNSYRSDGVDLEACSDTGCGDDLGWTAAGQWFKYTVNVATAGTYTVSFRFASPSGVDRRAAHRQLLRRQPVRERQRPRHRRLADLGDGHRHPHPARRAADPDRRPGQRRLEPVHHGVRRRRRRRHRTWPSTPPVTASSSTQNYAPANAVDGNTSTYWESHQRRLARHHHRQPRARRQTLGLPHHRPAAVERLVDPDPDPVRPRLHQRHHVLHPGRVRPPTPGTPPPATRSRSRCPPGTSDQYLAAQLHRQQRPERRPGIRDPHLLITDRNSAAGRGICSPSPPFCIELSG